MAYNQGAGFGPTSGIFNTSSAQTYLQNNPDVLKAYNESGLPSNAPYFMRDYADSHYTNKGINENRTGLPTAQTYSQTANNTSGLSMPSMSNENVPGWVNTLGDTGIPNYFDAYDTAKDLPNQIDDWMQNSINRQRMTGDHVKNIFTKVGNQRSNTGIMGGTEYENATSGLMADLAKLFEENQGNIELAGNQMKAQAISGMPSQAMMPINAMTSLYGMNANDQANYANLAAQLLNSNY